MLTLLSVTDAPPHLSGSVTVVVSAFSPKFANWAPCSVIEMPAMFSGISPALPRANS
jgi:hypothetical protein